MRTEVLLFASWSDALGPRLTLDLPDPASVSHLMAALGEKVAGRSLPKPLIAVNHRYARPETPIRSGDEVAIIPPVAGG